jgi:cytochrome c biogenesis protein CcmG/thiol:disulfide interchange protein DsbE
VPLRVDVSADKEVLRRRLSRWLAATAAGIFAILALLGLSSGIGVARLSTAPEFDLPLLGGGRVTNADLLGRAAVINVWASWCLPCREEAPMLRRVHAAADPERVVFLGVIRGDREQDAQRFVEDFDLAYANAVGDGGFARQFGVRGLPMTYVVDPAGRMIARHFGPISEQRLTALIEEALARESTIGDKASETGS